MEKKIYKIQDKDFTFKEIKFEQRNYQFILLKKLSIYMKDYVDNFSMKKLVLISNNPESVSDDDTFWFGIALQAFLNNPENLKDLFKNVLDGNVNEINFYIDDYDSIVTIGQEIFNDFFNNSKKVK